MWRRFGATRFALREARASFAAHSELTPAGAALERRLSESQRAIIADAFRRCGTGAVHGFRGVLLEMINPADRTAFLARVDPTPGD